MSDEIKTAPEEEVETPVVTEAPATEAPTETEAPVVEEAPNELLELSDEDFEKLEVEAPVESSTEAEETTETPTTTETTSETLEGGASETPVADGGAEATDETAKEVVKTEEAPATEETPEGAKPSSVVEAAKPKTEGVTDDVAIAGYKKILAPFKANGKTVQVKSEDEAIRLMQMGAGYTKTMMELKPQLAQVRTLKNNGIDDDTLNFLIEVKNGDPAAIKKLVRSHGIDPLDIETGEAGQAADASYRPKDYRASETQVEFEMTVSQVAATDHGKAVLESVQREWDGQSREAAYKDPAILGVLTEQKQSGIYDQITAQVDHEKMLGHLRGVSFLDAYQQVGTIMANNGLLKGTAPAPIATTETETTGTPAQQITTPGAESKVIERKAAVPKPIPNNNAQAKAVAPVASGAPAKALPVNPLNMSDEDFAALEGLEHLV